MIATAHLFPELHRHLVELLRSLGPDDWGRPTVAGAWRVRDVAAHLLDTQLRRLSIQRDGHQGAPPDRDLSDHGELVAFLNGLNATWVSAMERVSPSLLVDLLEVVGPQYADLVAGLEPEGRAIFPVAWAGEEESRNWFDVGRDFTELWHHQAQIRMAVGAPLLEERAWLHPVLAIALRALPRALASHHRPSGTTVVVHLDGEAGGVWHAHSDGSGWTVRDGAAPAPAAEVSMPASIAWRIFFNVLPGEEARSRIRSEGDGDLVGGVLAMRSVMV